ncbi:hypothetical protein M2093_001452 [Breznakia sp. PH1-1]|nr:hypothetical protein [Breznakia sp. PH1-1]MDH6404477.1 hypothetical protein [Breznakia sp. PF1-11]MDH6412132.1 hypothetical protein [Breznakia sp. PFB1-11]MDH6414465.1 hypothetical protein [Breznakia sp. PFB1-14]MDH6416850.1 hypothetical protein [Breznakia sp. PFB1-4]MDH6419219.1 hypothetical protein [Breznakia sp. PFB1-12]MDH6474138.1 hypothetical protein [Breznakia sp. PFB2-30]MDH6476536.1 hypothetical protein [Breznakia sp. PFB1-19]
MFYELTFDMERIDAAIKMVLIQFLQKNQI